MPKTLNQKDMDFLTMMTKHHQMALEMSRKYLEGKANSPLVSDLAKSIIASQSVEITRMQNWLKHLSDSATTEADAGAARARARQGMQGMGTP